MSKADKQSSPSNFYVYALLRGDTGAPFYVGKGRGKRWLHHESQARNGIKGHRLSIIRALLSRGLPLIKVKIHQDLTEAVAHAYEIALIAAIGRGAEGPLVNLTDGGDGISGATRDAQTREKIAAAKRGKALSPEWRAAISATKTGGLKRSAEGNAKHAAAMRGRKLSPEHIAKAVAGRKAKPPPEPRVPAIRGGWKHTPEARAKIAAAKRGRKLSPEHLAKTRRRRASITGSADESRQSRLPL